MTESTATTAAWHARCKDCEAVARSKRSRSEAAFSYTADAADLVIERGGSRSDRCPDCRKAHKRAIEAYPVAYVDVVSVGEVKDPEDPRGPLGGLGRLPMQHSRWDEPVDYSNEQFGMKNDDILRMLAELKRSDRRIAVVKAGTGTGKSTFMPFRLMNPPPNAAIKLRRRGPIIVTQPRILAARGISKFVGERLCMGHDPGCKGEHYGPGYAVGNQAEGVKFYDDSCGLIYVTEATLVNWIAQGRLARYSAIVIDEAHERSEHVDLILTLLHEQLPLYPHLYVFVTSATLDEDYFVGYFGGENQVHFVDIPSVKQIGYGVPLFPGEPIDESVIARGSIGANDDDSFPGWPAERINKEDLRETTRRLLTLRPSGPVGEGDMAAAVAAQTLRLLRGTPSGDILAFLPTVRQIDAAVTAIRAGLSQSVNTSVRIEGLARDAKEDVKKWAMAAASDGKRRVLVATTIAETSLTIKGIRFVIDSGKVNKPQRSKDSTEQVTVVADHSRSGVRQRWGRVGRDAPGWVFPLYSRAEYREFPKNTAPDVTRNNLEQYRLRLVAAGVDNLKGLRLPGLYTPGEPDADELAEQAAFLTEWERSGKTLETSGAVLANGHITSFGRELSSFSDVGRAMALALADRLTCAPEVAVALSLLGATRLSDRSGLLYYDSDWPASWRVRAAEAHRALALNCADELELVLRVYSMWQSADDPTRWARMWWVSTGALTAAQESAQKLLGILAPKMTKEAARALDLRLVGRARAVLATAFSAARYSRNGDGSWRRADTPDTVAYLDDRCLIEPSVDEVVALRRKELPAGLALGGVVLVPAWCKQSITDEFSFIVDACQHEPVPDEASGSGLLGAQVVWPIGTILSCTYAGRSIDEQPEVCRVSRPPLLPDDLPDLDHPDRRVDAASTAREKYSDKGFGDSPGARRAKTDFDNGRADSADDEQGNRLLPIENNEAPQDPGLSQTEGLEDEKSASSTVFFRFADGEMALRGERDELKAVITGYELDDGAVTLILSFAAVTYGDPCQHSAIALGDEITLLVGPTVRDYEKDYRYLVKEDGRGYFLVLRQPAIGLDRAGVRHIDEIVDGAACVATIIPGSNAKEAFDVTLLPGVSRRYLGSAVGTAVVAGRLIEQASGGSRISLYSEDSTARLGLVIKAAKDVHGTKLVPDTDLKVTVQRRGVLLPVDAPELAEAHAIADRSVGTVARARDGVRLRHTATAAALAELTALYNDDRAWLRKVWAMWVRSWALDGVKASPLVESVSIPAPAQPAVPTRSPLSVSSSQPPSMPDVPVSEPNVNTRSSHSALDADTVEVTLRPRRRPANPASGDLRRTPPRPPAGPRPEQRGAPSRRADPAVVTEPEPPRAKRKLRCGPAVAAALVLAVAIYGGGVATKFWPNAFESFTAGAGQAQGFDKMLDAAASAQPEVNAAISSVSKCGDTDAAASKIKDAIAKREAQKAQVTRLTLSALPSADALRQTALDAYNQSVAADRSYLTWVGRIGASPCKKTAYRGVSYHQGATSSAKADQAKAKLIELWNPIANTYGLSPRTATNL